jgi:hypothetical protein
MDVGSGCPIESCARLGTRYSICGRPSHVYKHHRNASRPSRHKNRAPSVETAAALSLWKRSSVWRLLRNTRRCTVQGDRELQATAVADRVLASRLLHELDRGLLDDDVRRALYFQDSSVDP